MKSNTFNYSLLALGITAILGLSTNAMAVTTQSAQATASINNIASATYKVGSEQQTPVNSNTVTINISETAAFSLTATNADGTKDDNKNENLSVVPKGTVVFTHTLENTGNLTDVYTMTLAQDGSTPADTADYDLSNTTVSYTIYNQDDTVSATVSGQTTSTFNATPIELTKGQRAEISVNAKTSGNKGGDTQNLTLTASSEYLTNDSTPDNDSVTNTDYAITRLPVFNIVKSVSDTLDLNDPNDTATYTITVTNDDRADYAVDATDLTIIDNLPLGLKLVEGSTSISQGNAIENTNGAGTGTTLDGFEITGVNLAVGDSITVTYQVQKDANEALAQNTINHASVEYVLDNNDPDTANEVLRDSTDSTNENANDYYVTDEESTDGNTPNPISGDSTMPLTANKRALTLSGSATKEIPNTSSATTEATYQTVITNTGKEVEGDSAGEVTFTITEGNNADISLNGDVTITYDADGTGGNAPASAVTITAVNGVYDINSALPTGMAPDSTVTITYNMASTQATINDTETTTVQLVPGGVDAPADNGNFVVINTTEVHGLTLQKNQALDANCDGTIEGSFVDTALSADPSECVIYQIVATSGFDNLDITDLLIYDTTSRFSNKASYVSNSGTITVSSNDSVASNPVNNDADNTDINEAAVYTTVNTLKAGDVATLTFAIQLDASGAAQ